MIALFPKDFSIYFSKITNQNPFRKTSLNQLLEEFAAAARYSVPAVITNLKDYY
jgi:hypothetical protein